MKPAILLLILSAALHAEWITPKGKAYHTSKACMALTRSKELTEVSKAEAEKRGLHLCGICGRAKKGTK